MLTCLYDVVGYALLGYMCLFPCYVVRSLSSHAYMLGFMFFYVYVLSFYMSFLHVYVYVSMLVWLDLFFHMPMYLDLHSLHALYYLPCACVLHAMFVCLDLDYVCHAMWYCSLFVTLSFFIVFWPIGWTRSRTYGLFHCLYTLAHIKGFGSSLFACLCLLASTLYACVSLFYSRLSTLDAFSGFVVVWLHLTLHEALFGCNHLVLDWSKKNIRAID